MSACLPTSRIHREILTRSQPLPPPIVCRVNSSQTIQEQLSKHCPGRRKRPEMLQEASGSDDAAMIVCTYEDRPSAFVGVKLLLLTLSEHAKNIRADVWLPESEVEVGGWIRQKGHRVRWVPENFGVRGWSVKPTFLLHYLARGAETVVWLDSDLLLTGDPRFLFQQDPDCVFVATEEPLLSAEPQGSRIRTESAGRAVGRILPRTVNSAVLKVGQEHIALLEEWKKILSSNEYAEAQRRSFPDRPIHLKSDQDVLTAILGSDEFVDVRLRLLRAGREIAHCMDNVGYRVKDRLRNCVGGLPLFVHAQGRKPWDTDRPISSQLSPYCWVAEQYVRDVPEIVEWVRPRDLSAKFINAIFFGSPNLRGLPLGLVREMEFYVRRILSPNRGKKQNS